MGGVSCAFKYINWYSREWCLKIEFYITWKIVRKLLIVQSIPGMASTRFISVVSTEKRHHAALNNLKIIQNKALLLYPSHLSSSFGLSCIMKSDRRPSTLSRIPHSTLSPFTPYSGRRFMGRRRRHRRRWSLFTLWLRKTVKAAADTE